MEFHPQKCNVLFCSRAKRPIAYSYKLKGHTLEHSISSKYLGVDISNDLSWNPQVDRTIKKTNIMIGFLKGNLKTANETTKSNAYRALVRPHLEYCSAVWNLHTADKTKKIEAVQRRAA